MIVVNQEFKYRNESDRALDVVYASVTAREITRFDVLLVTEDGKSVQVDCVYAGAGGSHSWWSASGGKMLGPEFPNGLPPNATLIIRGNTKETAIRVDFFP